MADTDYELRRTLITMRRLPAAGVVLLVLLFATRNSPVIAQQAPSLHSIQPEGQLVTPVFDGWFRNPDGTYSLSFGYFSRNSEEVVEIPLGADNFIEPIIFDGKQPTHFQPQPQDRGPGRGIRHWGVFTVIVPEDFGEQRVVWTLRARGEAASVPGHLTQPNYEIDALGVAARGYTPPALRLSRDGPQGNGPGGVSIGPISATVGMPLKLTVWTSSDSAPPVTLRWFKHQGPGEVVFDDRELRVSPSIEEATTTAIFSAPGKYMLRVRATDEATEFDRYCCWTNGYVEVVVTQ